MDQPALYNIDLPILFLYILGKHLSTEGSLKKKRTFFK